MTTGQKLPGMTVVGAACVPLPETGSVGWLPSCSASCSLCWSVPLERKQGSRIGCDVLSSGTELLQSRAQAKPAGPSPTDPLRPPPLPKGIWALPGIGGCQPSHASRGISSYARPSHPVL
ncbi:Uncharacterised protein [Chlamydia abortus]|nr:Uncharacterised protein [Chlamydia abortus]